MSHVKGKNKNQILEEMCGTAQVGSIVHEQQKMAIMVRCTEDIENAISKLNRKINGLDIALKIATIIGGIATGLMAYKIFFP